MSNTLMGTLQQAIRNTFGCANDFNGDLHVLCDYWGIPMVPISGRTIDVARKYDASITDATSALNYLLYNPTTAVPGLALNFVNNETLDPRITFSRTSNATQFDSAGALVYAPHNLLLFSEQFDNAAWVKQASVSAAANTTVAPNGTTTADTVTADSGVGAYQNVTTTVGTTITQSVYIKAGTATAVMFRDDTGSGRHIVVNTSTGAITSTSGTLIASGSQPAANGFFRIFFTYVADTTLVRGIIRPDSAGSAQTFIVWGAQTNAGTLQPYYPTTVKNALGYSQEFDNAAWTKTNSFVQTNLLTFSEQFDNAAWQRFGTTTVSANTTVAPDGTTTADSVTLPTSSGIYQIVSGAAGVTYTFSVYIRAAAATTARLVVNTNLSDPVTQSINVTTQWQRFTLSKTTSVGTTTVTGQIDTGGGATFFVWGAQLVQGSVPGDYVRTDATARAVMYPAPDGSVTADKIVETAATGTHSLLQGYVFPTAPLTLSFYAKAAERTRIRFVAATGGGGVLVDANLTAETVSAGAAFGSGFSVIGTSITPFGGGWYRVALRFNATAGSGSAQAVLLDASGNNSYTGDGTSGIFIWGAQLSDSASLDPYVYNPAAAPTAAAYYGPRFDYDPVTLAARGLLIEEQRTNSIRNNTMQGAVGPSTFPTNWQSVTVAGLTPTVVGTGVENGVTYLDVRVSGTPAASSFYNLVPDILIAGAAGQTWAGSFWAKLVAGSLTNTAANIELRESDAAQGFLINSLISLPISSTLTRYSLVRTLTNASTAFASIRFVWQITNGLPVDFTLRIGLPQLELGAFATSVIPTTTAAATRTADVATMVGANFSNWYNATQGTFFAEYTPSAVGPATAAQYVLAASDGTTSNTLLLFKRANADVSTRYNVNTGGVNQVFSNLGTFTAATNKAAVAYQLDNFAGVLNNASVVADTSATVPTLTQTYLGSDVGAGTQLNGHLRRIAYYPTRLSNAQLQAVTA